MKKSLICINCPRGCHLEISGDKDNWSVSGNQCPRGVDYAIQEATDPRRTVTAAVPAQPGTPCAAVRTSAPLPVALIPGLLNELYKMQLSTPAKKGDILLADWQGSGVDVIFSADFPQPY